MNYYNLILRKKAIHVELRLHAISPKFRVDHKHLCALGPAASGCDFTQSSTGCRALATIERDCHASGAHFVGFSYILEVQYLPYDWFRLALKTDVKLGLISDNTPKHAQFHKFQVLSRKKSWAGAHEKNLESSAIFSWFFFQLDNEYVLLLNTHMYIISFIS